jgi:hypothetical protein
MSLFAWILMFAATTSVDLVDESYQIPPDGWFCVPIDLRQHPALVAAGFHVESGSEKVRLLLVTKGEFARMQGGLSHNILALSPSGRYGNVHYRVRRPGDYVLVVDNRASKDTSTAVHLRVALDFAHPAAPNITTAEPERQLTVIGLSFVFFFGIVTYSTRRLLKATRRE